MYTSDLNVMGRLRRRFKTLRFRLERKSYDVIPPAEGRTSKSQRVGTYNKYLCPVCRPAMDFIHDVLVSAPEAFRVEGYKTRMKYLEYYRKNRTLQDSVDEGCYLCTRIADYLLLGNELNVPSARELTLHSSLITEDEGEYYKVFDSRLVKTQESFVPDVDQNRSAPDFSEHLYFGPLFGVIPASRVPLESARKSNCRSDILLDYQPLADMMATPLWTLITAWIERCSTEHQCSNASTISNPVFPLRLVELEKTDAGIKARLVDTGVNGFIRRSPYLTLSHMWGTEPFLTLTSSNCHEFYTQIPIHQLRAQFRDAFTITYKLGFRYIWIDSLCIIQDRIDDWRTELAKMGDIYRGSVCNIAACVSSPRSGNLLERHRDLQSITFLEYIDAESNDGFRCLPLEIWEQGMDNEPLNKRGWVLQERLLAPRTLYLGGKQVFWECCEITACEVAPKGVSIAANNLKKWRADARFMGKSNVLRYEAYETWYKIIQVYSGSGLTNEKDKLIALSGIAKEMQIVLQDTYLAGLWKRNSLQGLLWEVTSSQECKRPQGYCAPSWSWACVDGAVRQPSRYFCYELAEIREAFTDPLANDPTSEIKGAYVKICGILRTLRCTATDSRRDYSFEGIPMDCVFDTLQDSELEEINCIVLGLHDSRVRGLLIKSTGQESREYQRVGVFSIRTDSPNHLDSLAAVLGFCCPWLLFYLDSIHLPFTSEGSPDWELEAKMMRATEVAARARRHIEPFMEEITII